MYELGVRSVRTIPQAISRAMRVWEREEVSLIGATGSLASHLRLVNVTGCWFLFHDSSGQLNGQLRGAMTSGQWRTAMMSGQLQAAMTSCEER